MKIVFDREKCQGHGRCYSLAPQVFDTDDEGYAVLLVGGAEQGDVPAELEDQAQLAADNCPEYAIEIQR
jgi:ferredoxin